MKLVIDCASLLLRSVFVDVWLQFVCCDLHSPLPQMHTPLTQLFSLFLIDNFYPSFDSRFDPPLQVRDGGPHQPPGEVRRREGQVLPARLVRRAVQEPQVGRPARRRQELHLEAVNGLTVGYRCEVG